jgi:hypothetical protein
MKGVDRVHRIHWRCHGGGNSSTERQARKHQHGDSSRDNLPQNELLVEHLSSKILKRRQISERQGQPAAGQIINNTKAGRFPNVPD